MAVITSRWRLAALALAVPALAVSAPSGLPEDFVSWASEHGKDYATEQAWRRALERYQANEEIIRRLNSNPEDDAVYGHTRFSDLSPAEFRERYVPMKLDPEEGRRGSAAMPPIQVPDDLPTAVDWRDQGAVTPVRDQGHCGSCWAESAVANIESQWYLAKRASGMQAPIPLSVQQVVECDPHDNACYGGYPKGAYQYVIEHGGLAAETDYPYNVAGHVVCLANQTFNETCGNGICDDPPLTNYCDLKCTDKVHNPVAQISSWTALPPDEDSIAAYLAEHGPVSVGLDSSGSLSDLGPWLQFYKSGVANPYTCTTQIDHGVLAVGFGEESGKKYWTIKNSWGSTWGESGFFRLVRGTGKCGINLLVSSSIVASQGQSSQLVV